MNVFAVIYSSTLQHLERVLECDLAAYILCACRNIQQLSIHALSNKHKSEVRTPQRARGALHAGSRPRAFFE